MVLDVGSAVLERAIGFEIDAYRPAYLPQAHNLTTYFVFPPKNDIATPVNGGLSSAPKVIEDFSSQVRCQLQVSET